MLYRTIKRMITRGQTEGLAEKVEVFRKAGKLTQARAEELGAMLAAAAEN